MDSAPQPGPLITPVPMQARRRWTILRSPVAALDAVRYVFRLVRVLYLAFASLFLERSRGRRASNRILLQQIYFTAVQALPLTIFIAIAFGSLAMIQASVLLPRFGMREVEKITGFLVFREIAPICVAVIVIARSANAIVVEIGNMHVNGEMDSLETLGINVDRYIVLPRVTALLISVPLLTVTFCFAGVWGGFWAGRLSGLLESNFVFSRLVASVDLETLKNLLVRSLSFGAIISAVSCLHGLRVKRSPTEVPQQATRGVIGSLGLCFVTNFVVSLTRIGP